MRDKIHGEEVMDGVADARRMADMLLCSEFRGPGDTIEAAAYRVERKWGVPAALILRMRHRTIKDMLLSNYLTIRAAYETAVARAERAYEHERALADAANPAVVRAADLVAGKKTEDAA